MDQEEVGTLLNSPAQGVCPGRLQEVGEDIPCIQIVIYDCHSQYTHVTCHLTP